MNILFLYNHSTLQLATITLVIMELLHCIDVQQLMKKSLEDDLQDLIQENEQLRQGNVQLEGNYYHNN